MLGRRGLALAFVTTAGCSFDSSGVGAGADARADDAAPRPDAPPPSFDASPCPSPFAVELRVNGEETAAAPGEPIAEVMVGDAVVLSAAGSCVQAGPIAYQWEIQPDDGTLDTALPSRIAQEITIYSMKPGTTYTVRLVVGDAAGGTQAREVLAFAVYGWAFFGGGPGNGDVRDLSFGGGNVWIAAKDGPYRLDIADRAGSFRDVDAELDGDDPGNELEVVWFDDAANLAWFGHKDARTGVWRASRGAGRIDQVRYDGAGALGAAAEVLDIDSGEAGVAVATSLGVTFAPDNLAFVGRFTPLDPAVHAIDRGAAGSWAGGARLYDLDDAGAVLDPFAGAAGPDAKIRAIAVDDASGETWVATQDDGVARIDTATGATVKIYGEGDGLPSRGVRDLAIETTGRWAGDVWAATDKGVARYARARDEWIAMDEEVGIVPSTDVRAVAIDSDRWIYGGTEKGVVYIRLP